jgi:hypothetical protein
MSRVPFKEADVTRALKGAQKAGLYVARASIDRATGNIDLVFGTEPSDNALDTTNPWDEVHAANKKRPT